MTKEQLEYLRRILAPASAPIPREQRKSPRWRSCPVPVRAEVSLGTILRRNDYSGPTDWR